MSANRIPGAVGLEHDATSARLPRSLPGTTGLTAVRHAPLPSLLLRGDFTMLKYVVDLSAEALERHVGFHPGRLKAGFRIAVLAPGEMLRPEDFELGASTRWSGGKITSATGKPVADNIAELLEKREQDVVSLKAKVAAFFHRRGGNTPAKVLPTIAHQPWMVYPDATVIEGLARSGIPQFKLVRSRKFIVLKSSLGDDSAQARMRFDLNF